MATVVLFTNNIAQYLPSVNTPDYISNPGALINPNLTALVGVPTKYWKRVANTVVEMTQVEKDAVLAAELLARKNTANTLSVQDIRTVLTALIKVINVRFSVGQKITTQEMVDALKAEIT